ncbi:MAG: amidohydrolase family protein, partial [Spirochaetales bacterium]|nr:amidohydrolase family protein [Spirochaetales bacterium]
LKPEMENTGFGGTVSVQARQMIEETEFLLDLADTHPWILGVVGWLDFESEDFQEDLERLSARKKLKGLRELIHDMPDTEYALSLAHVQAIGALGKHGLTYDLLLRPDHIPSAIRLADMYPNQPFVVDHLAKPLIEAQVIEPWRKDLLELAQRGNINCKLSGMVTEANWEAWKPEDLQPYMDVVLEAFGPERIMIGSDWPVCTCAGNYRVVMNTTVDYVSRLSRDEQDQILGNTCGEFYGLYT